MSDVATEFSYTPDLLPWIKQNAPYLNEDDMAAMLGCAPGTLRNICGRHGISLCATSDRHAIVSPFKPSVRREYVSAAPPTRPKVHPRLNPELRRGAIHLARQDLQIQKNAIAIIDREAAKRFTSPSILMAVIVEIVALEDLFEAILPQED